MRRFKDAGIALSLANLCFFSVWAQLLPGAYGHYFLKSPPTVAVHAAVLLDVLALAAILWCSMRLARRSGRAAVLTAARCAFLLILLVVLNVVRHHSRPLLAGQPLLMSASWPPVIKVILLAFALVVAWRWFQRVVRAAALVTLVLLPFAFLTFAQSARAAIDVMRHVTPAEFTDRGPAPPHPARPAGAPRVVWFLFDGLDYRWTFTERPPTLQMPNVDRFRGGALFATHAYSPAGNTLLSVPALLTGRPIEAARPVRANELMVKFSDAAQPKGWSTFSTIFSEAQALGFNTAVAGYYHPYSRLFGRDLTRCSWETDWWQPIGLDDPSLTVPQAMRLWVPRMLDGLREGTPVVNRWPLRGFAETLLDNARDPHRQRREHIGHYQRTLEAAGRIVTDPSLGMVLVHWPIPHRPPIYDRFAEDFDWRGERTYVDNLALVDRTLGQMRHAMEAAGTWETTTILITPDHWFERHDRTDLRVPFVLKLAGQQQPLVYDPSFNTLLLHDFVLAVLRGELSTPAQVVRWLDVNRSRVATPVPEIPQQEAQS